MGNQAGKCFDKNGMTDIHGGLPPGAGSETGEERGIRWDHCQMISEIHECKYSVHMHLLGSLPREYWIRGGKMEDMPGISPIKSEITGTMC